MRNRLYNSIVKQAAYEAANNTVNSMEKQAGLGRLLFWLGRKGAIPAGAFGLGMHMQSNNPELKDSFKNAGRAIMDSGRALKKALLGAGNSISNFSKSVNFKGITPDDLKSVTPDMMRKHFRMTRANNPLSQLDRFKTYAAEHGNPNMTNQDYWNWKASLM